MFFTRIYQKDVKMLRKVKIMLHVIREKKLLVTYYKVYMID